MTLREFLARMKDAPTIGRTKMYVPAGNCCTITKAKQIPIVGIIETSYSRGIPKFVVTNLKKKEFDEDYTQVEIDMRDNIIKIWSGDAWWERPYFTLRIAMEAPEKRS